MLTGSLALAACVLLIAIPGQAQANAHDLSAPSVSSEIHLGDSVVPLYGPWKFTIGDSPLDRRYRRFSKTGKPGYGDPSEMIHSGEISRRGEQRPSYSIPSALIDEAVRAHAECLAACRMYCVPVSDLAQGRESAEARLQLAI